MQQCMKLSLTNRSIGLIPSLCTKQRENNPVTTRDEYPRRFPKGEPVDKGPPVRQLPQREAADRRDPNCPTIPAREWSNEYSGPNPGRQRPNKSVHTRQRPGNSCVQRLPAPALARLCLDDLVAMARGQTPDPIPNSAVKTLSADGTAS